MVDPKTVVGSINPGKAEEGERGKAVLISTFLVSHAEVLIIVVFVVGLVAGPS